MGRNKTISLFILILAVFLIWSGVFQLGGKDYLEITFFDIGQGDSVFLETPSGVQALFDGGPDRNVLNKLGDELPFFDREIDYLFISHPDKDHIGGLIPILDKYKVLNVVVSGVRSDTEIYKTLLQKIADEGSNYYIARAGTVFDLNDGVLVKVLFPDRNSEDFEPNTGSLITQIDFNEVEVLLTGDAPKSIEKYLVDLYGDSLKSEILKAGHHGSKTSNSEEFLADVSPEFFVISVGENNKYGHPNKEVLDILQKLNLNFFRTDEKGNITFFTDGKRIWK